MPKAREELRRGVRDLIEVASREMEALSEDQPLPGPAPDEVPPAKPDRPILRLVRDPAARPPAAPDAVPVPGTAAVAGFGGPVAAPTAPPPVAPPVEPVVVQAAPAPEVRPAPSAAPIYGVPPDASGVHPKRGVCAAYYINHACWEVADAYCNQALHVCMLRDCPVYNLNREELERRFAAKFAHLW